MPVNPFRFSYKAKFRKRLKKVHENSNCGCFILDDKDKERIYASIEKTSKIQKQLNILERKTYQKKFLKTLTLFASLIILIVWVILMVGVPKTAYGFYFTVGANFLFFMIIIAILGLDTFSDSVKERESAVNTLKIDVVKDDILSLQKECSELNRKYNELLKEKS
jgi:hypothetical protein